MMTRHDPYLSMTLDAIGTTATIVALQHCARTAYRNYETTMRLKSFDYLFRATEWQRQAAWASKNARILMGIE